MDNEKSKGTQMVILAEDSCCSLKIECLQRQLFS